MDNGSKNEEPQSLRLSEISLNNRFSGYNQNLSPLDRILEESIFHFKMISEKWGALEFSAFAVGVLAIILGSFDWGIGELSGGGDYNRVGSEGILFLSDLSLILTLLSIIAWVVFALQLFIRFPIMRENLVYMFIGMIAVQVGYIYTYADTPNFPRDFSFSQLSPILLTNAIFAFLSIFVVHRAVTETRDVHVIERHSHPDPRVVQIAWKDHSLKLWSIGLGLWMILVNLFSWAGANSIAPRPVSVDVSVFNYPWIYLISSIISIFLFIHILWYPQFMLGGAEDRIQSVRAREVSGEMNITSTQKLQGICPICNEETPATKYPSGQITVLCQQFKCEGVGKPGTICEICEMTFPSRIECNNCKSNTTISSHFDKQDAW
jgi:hypothetical protein